MLKDGASAIYGSDAIAGVVNVITRPMNGIETNLYTSTSNNADGTNYDLSAVAGYSWDRGNITLSGGYQDQKPVMARDRDFSRQPYTYDYTCTAERQARDECIQAPLTGSAASSSGRINTMPSGGPPLNIPGCNTRYCTADGNGGFRNFVNPIVTPSGNDFGDAYNFETLNYLVTPSTRINLFSSGHFDITRNLHGFVEGQFHRRTSAQQLAEVPLELAAFGTPLSAKSIYNPFGQDVADDDLRLVELGPRTLHQEVNTTRRVVGLDGTFDDPPLALRNWTWEASYSHGRSDAIQDSHGDVILSHLANAIGPSFRDAQGAHCGTPGNVIDGCVPLDLLHPDSGNITPAAINYLAFSGRLSGFNEQDTVLLQASGTLLELPNHAGLSLAVGGDYRSERGGQQLQRRQEPAARCLELRHEPPVRHLSPADRPEHDEHRGGHEQRRERPAAGDLQRCHVERGRVGL